MKNLIFILAAIVIGFSSCKKVMKLLFTPLLLMVSQANGIHQKQMWLFC